MSDQQETSNQNTLDQSSVNEKPNLVDKPRASETELEQQPDDLNPEFWHKVLYFIAEHKLSRTIEAHDLIRAKFPEIKNTIAMKNKVNSCIIRIHRQWKNANKPLKPIGRPGFAVTEVSDDALVAKNACEAFPLAVKVEMPLSVMVHQTLTTGENIDKVDAKMRQMIEFIWKNDIKKNTDSWNAFSNMFNNVSRDFFNKGLMAVTRFDAKGGLPPRKPGRPPK